MIFLQSHDRFAEHALFDPDTGQLQILTKADSASGDGLPVRGHFTVSHEEMILYRRDHTLRLRCGRQDVRVYPGVILERLEIAAGHACLVIGTTVQTTVEYHFQPNGGIAESADFTPMKDPEDFDFGLFVINVVNTEGRAERLYGVG